MLSTRRIYRPWVVERDQGLLMLRPAVKRVHRPFVLPDGRIRLGLEQDGVAAEIDDDDSGSLECLLGLLDGTRDEARIWADLHAIHPDWELDDVLSAIDQLAEAGHLED